MIYGERIRLRAIKKENLPLFVEWFNDPEVIQGTTHYLPFSLEDEEEWYEIMRERPGEERGLSIEILTEDGWEPIGNCGLFNFDWRIRTANFGIVIGNKAQWNKGYGTEATRLVLEYGFNTLNLNRIALRVFENNPQAIRTYEKAGFTLEGRLRQGHFQDGKYIDVLLMSALRDEWQEPART